MKWMKCLFLLFICQLQILFIPNTTVAQETPTIAFNHDAESLDKILTAIKSENKSGMLYFTGAFCPPCKRLQRDVFPDKNVIEFVEDNFIPYWFGVGI